MGSAPVTKQRRHKGDIMSPAKRSAVMARIRGKDTLPERLIAEALKQLGLSWDGHVGDLPGRPDFVFRDAMVVVFVDGDFWHGWRFSIWHDKLTEAWEAKIAANRSRDHRNHRRLRKMGWKVIRLWEHQINRDINAAIKRVLDATGYRYGRSVS